jgi:cyanophycinase
MYATVLMMAVILFVFLIACDNRQTEINIQEEEEQAKENVKTKGPENGTLLIIGGQGSEMLDRKFMELAGGSDSPIVVVPTAESDEVMNEDYLESYRKGFVDKGFTNVTVLHTRDRNIANTDEFIAPLREAMGVWLSGGRQWRLADSYLNTRTHEAFNDVLKRGGVIAGTSAGATIQGSFLARGDSKSNLLPIGDHQVGFGFITNVAIDQHILPRNRLFDMFEILSEHPELLGIGIDEYTAIIVNSDKFSVIGPSYVAIYDGTIWSEEKDSIYRAKSGEKVFYLLRNGHEYDLSKRKVITFEDREFIQIPSSQLEKYAGIYQANGNLKMSLTIESDTLKVTQEWGNYNKYPIFPESDTNFYDRQLLFQFRIDGDGTINSFSIPADNLEWIRIDDPN